MVCLARLRRGRSFNLALQGGGVLGAFTWGVLDRLLETDRFPVAAVSGTSAGAVNAVLLAAGLMEEGREGARRRLNEFWRGLARIGTAGLAPELLDLTAPFRHIALELATRHLSPYQANPFGYNPLREHLGRLVDFPRLAKESPVALLLATLDIASGRARLFRTSEVSLDVVLASAALPQLHHAVEIEGRHYWDGGYLVNPPLVSLISDATAARTLLIKLLPDGSAILPRSQQQISDRLGQILFAEPLRRELALHELARRLGWLRSLLAPPPLARLARHRLYVVDGGERLQHLLDGSPLIPANGTILRLHEEGLRAAEDWLAGPPLYVL